MGDSREKIVHVVGEYVPVSPGPDGISEREYFQQLFFSANQKLGVQTHFPSALTESLVMSMQPEDVVVLLNPGVNCVTNAFSSRYRKLVFQLPTVIGRGRTVLAFQDTEAKRSLRLSRQFPLFEISYAPVFSGSRPGPETVVPIDPAPEEAVGIVAKILSGKNPDVYA